MTFSGQSATRQAFWDVASVGHAEEGKQFFVPFLTDMSCGIAGYREGVMDSILRAPSAILMLLEDQGVGEVWVPAASWAEMWRWQAISRDVPIAPEVFAGGPILVDVEPTSDRQRWIRDRSDLSSALGIIEREGCGWVILQSDDIDFAQMVSRDAKSMGLRVGLRGSMEAATVLMDGDLYCGFPNINRSSLNQSLTDLMMSWSQDSLNETLNAARAMLSRGVMISTELITLHRTVFVKESLDTPFLEFNEPILPHVRWLIQMRRAGGFAAGKSALFEYSGLREPSRSQVPLLKNGWDRLVECAVTLFLEFEGLRPGSGAPQLAVIPGRGLREELALLHVSGVPLQDVLMRASNGMAGQSGSNSRWLATETYPEDGARFIMSLRPQQ